MFKTRLISGILLVIIAFVTIWFGGPILWATTLLISLVGVFELNRIEKTEKELPGFVTYAATIGYYLLLLFDHTEWMGQGIVIFFMLLMSVYVFTYPKYVEEQMVTAFFAVFYVAVMLSYIYRTRSLSDHGLFLVGLIFLSSWGCDTCAYCVGVLFGKHKMAPVLSPKKSIEGAVGGLVGAALLGALYAFLGNKFGGQDAKLWAYALICFVGGMLSMVGDLTASAIKRNKGIKDYGKLIPGHGGVLDRFDSVIFTAPVIYYLAIALL